VKPSHAASDNLIDRTRQVWQPRLGRDLTREDARQIAENVTGFFALLTEWSRVQHAGSGESRAPAVSSGNADAPVTAQGPVTPLTARRRAV
jgi:hypothetical protein